MKGIWVLGEGAAGPLGLAGLEGAPETAGPRCVPPELNLKEGFPPQALRWADPLTLFWLNAARQAQAGAGFLPDQGTGQVVGLGWGPTAPVLALLEPARQGDFASMNPSLFPYSVGNAPAGMAGLLLRLDGPAQTLHGKEAGGLAALVEAARMLSGGVLERCVAGGTDHLDPVIRQVVEPYRGAGAMPLGEGAYALGLASLEEAPERGVRVAAWSARSASCPPHRFPSPAALYDRLLDSLLERAGWGSDYEGLVFLQEDTPPVRREGAQWLARRLPKAHPEAFQERLGACGAAWAGAAVLGTRALREGRARRALLLAVATGGAGWGLALERSDAE